MEPIDRIDRLIIQHMSGDIGGDRRPYRVIAEKVGVGETEVVDRVRRFNEAGLLRRLGAVLGHRRAGFSANGMVVWNVSDDRIDEVGPVMASFQEVSHCYVRPRLPHWPGNFYTMVHGKSEDACRESARKMSETTGLKDYKILFSTRELKKTSMVYFADEK
jgi:DNA-binding Lrp family transcriptional regulator